MSLSSSVAAPQSLSLLSKSFHGQRRPARFRASADVPDFLSADWLESRKKRPCGPRLNFSAEEAVSCQLEALKYNDQPHPDYGIEVMYRFTGFDPFERSTYFGPHFDLGQFERFRRIFHHSSYRVLLGHKERKILSSLWVKENRFKQRVWVQGTRPAEEEIFEFTMVQRLGGSWDGYWLTESLHHDGDSFAGERFVVLSYNILADYLANSHGNLYFHIPPRFMSWDWRKGNILFELARWSPDIMCFQEVDKFHELEEDLRHHGYSGIWKMRTGKPIDGCAVFWRTSRFKLVYEECIEFNKLGMRDNVAQICVLESLFKNHTDKRLTSSESTEDPTRVVICNIHVLYNPRRGEIKLGQVRVLLERAEAISKNWDGASVVLCGDFNCTPKSPLYNFISEQKLDISELERDKVSGQAAAVLHPPPRQFGHNARGQSSGNIASPTMTQNISVDGKQNTSIENQHASESILGNLPTVYNHSINSSMVSEEASVKTSHNVEDPSKENDGSLVSVSIGNLRDEDHSGHTDKSTDDIRSAQSAEQLASESEQDPEVTSSVAYTEKGIGSGFSPEEHVLKDILTSEENKRNCSNDILSPSIDDSNNKCGEEDPRDSCNTNNYQSGSNCNISCSESAVSDMPSHVVDAEAKPGPTNVCVASEANKLSFKNDIDKKLIGLSLNGMDESVEDNEGLVEDAEKFMSDLNNDADPFPSNLGDMVVEYLSSTPKSHAVDVNKPSYDPSMWTPIEIATATGNANNTNLEHSLKLTSTYTEVEDYSGTRDSNGEPLVTSYNTCFMGTVDYIWRSEGLRTVKVLAPISKDVMQATGGFPTKKWGSDHIALASELAFTK